MKKAAIVSPLIIFIILALLFSSCGSKQDNEVAVAGTG